jgi:integrase
MARPRKTDPPDLSAPCELTVGTIERLACPPGKAQAFLRDAKGNGLRVRVTTSGKKTFVFEQSLKNTTIRRTIGEVGAWTIDAARAEAKRLSVLLDKGTDPRELDREQAEVKAAAAAEKAEQGAAAAAEQVAQSLTAREVWDRYVAERRPHWGDKHHADHLSMANPGGDPRKRGKGTTKHGVLAPLLAMRLLDLDAKTIEAWATKESKTRPARVRLGLRHLKAFFNWAAAESDLSDKVDPAAASAKKARVAAGKPKPKKDVIERGQLSAWFAAVRGIHNPVISAYLQTLLLTGARPGEVLELRWCDLNTQWMSIAIRDKVEGERQIPLTPFVWSLLSALPRRNEWLFSGGRALLMTEANIHRRRLKRTAQGAAKPAIEVLPSSASGRLVEPGIAHRQACAVAGLQGLTLHGLRRSFKSLTEWMEIPAGVVAQLMGHKPSATAEKHYTIRPLDLLRVHHECIEAWVLEQAGVPFDSKAAQAGLTLVA